MLETIHLTKSYNGSKALNDLNLNIRARLEPIDLGYIHD